MTLECILCAPKGHFCSLLISNIIWLSSLSLSTLCLITAFSEHTLFLFFLFFIFSNENCLMFGCIFLLQKVKFFDSFYEGFSVLYSLSERLFSCSSILYVTPSCLLLLPFCPDNFIFYSFLFFLSFLHIKVLKGLHFHWTQPFSL